MSEADESLYRLQAVLETAVDGIITIDERVASLSSRRPIFPCCSQISAREALPARGNMLRHTYRTIAADLSVDDLLIHFLMGHTPRGISRKMSLS
jgi:hypothetical protein